MMTRAHSYILALASNEEVERSLRYHLTRNGYGTHLVSDVHQAVKAVESLRPLLLVIDRRTKGISQIPEHNIFRNIVSLVIEPPGSACTEDEYMEAVNHGFDFVICGETYPQLIAHSCREAQTNGHGRFAAYNEPDRCRTLRYARKT